MHHTLEKPADPYAVEIIRDAPTDPDAFLAWTATLGDEYEGYKIELARGQVTKQMINVRRGHSKVCWNILRQLSFKLDPKLYIASSADFGVKIRHGVRYPDILVEPMHPDDDARASDNPIFIAEVLSPSTMSVDFLEKLPEYTAIASLQTYLICSQDEPVVWVMTRREDGSWPDLPQRISGRSSAIAVPGLKLELLMGEVYLGFSDPGEPG